MAQPEQFDILVLGRGTAGKLIAWQWRDRAGGLRSWSAVGRGLLSQHRLACRARMRSGANNLISSGRPAGWRRPGMIERCVAHRRRS